MNDGRSVNYKVKNLPHKSRPLTYTIWKYMEVTVYIYHSQSLFFVTSSEHNFFCDNTKQNQFVELNSEYAEV